MRILRHIADVPEAARGGVVVIGNFDGLHRGHQHVLAVARAAADAAGQPLVLMTFKPHPRSYFRPQDPPFRLTPFRAKARTIAGLGVDYLLVCRFDAAMAQVSAETFIDRYLVDGLGARHIVVGYNFAFGHRRRGNAAMLREAGVAHAFEVTVVEPVAAADGEAFSSSTIRQCLRDGNPRRAAALLGRLWEIEGRVLAGDRRGRTIGFPTANIDPTNYAQVAPGVYAVRAGVTDDGETQWYDGVANLGVRPTVDGKRFLLETHLFDFAGDLYGRYLRVGFVDYLRPERKFENFEALRRQIALDSEQARAVLTAYAAEADD